MNYTPILGALLMLCTSCATVSTDRIDRPQSPAPLRAKVRKAEVVGPVVLYRPVDISVRRAGAKNVDMKPIRLRAAATEPEPKPLAAPTRVFHPGSGQEIVIQLSDETIKEIEAASTETIYWWRRDLNQTKSGTSTGWAPDDEDFWDYHFVVYYQWSLALELDYPWSGEPILSLTIPLGRPMPTHVECGTVAKKPGLQQPPKSLADFGPPDETGRAPLSYNFLLHGLSDRIDR